MLSCFLEVHALPQVKYHERVKIMNANQCVSVLVDLPFHLFIEVLAKREVYYSVLLVVLHVEKHLASSRYQRNFFPTMV